MQDSWLFVLGILGFIGFLTWRQALILRILGFIGLVVHRSTFFVSKTEIAIIIIIIVPLAL
jgi:hypothetical protein